ncbi:SDR family oxidoreductase [Candidatus Pelagibacter sp.]|nr:SDR family oxidoreductase [Candidatus Pelagibacter sp.]
MSKKNSMKKILITGGCGYVGTVLSEYLLKKNYHVTSIDLMWFGNYLKKKRNLVNKKKDFSELKNSDFKNIDTVIHLANIANDPSGTMNPSLTWDVNVIKSQRLLEKCIKNKVKRFIYASSGSVYGINKKKKVTEDLPLVPISEYNKSKMIFEKILFSYKTKMKIYCIRPATVCGVSPRMRWDISVNILTLNAIKNKIITVFGGNQTRPNIHITDLIRIYDFFLSKKNIPEGIYNAAFEIFKIKDVAKIIQKKTKAKIKYLKSNDPRSYRQNSDKIIRLGFKPLYKIEDAVDDIIYQYNKKIIKDKTNCYNLKQMKKLKLNTK